jgi:hypothetical protein
MHIFFAQAALDKLFFWKVRVYRGRLSLAVAMPCVPVSPGGIDAPRGVITRVEQKLRADWFIQLESMLPAE